MEPTVNCKQRQRTKLIPESAKMDLDKYKLADVFMESTGGSDQYWCNITLTKRPSGK